MRKFFLPVGVWSTILICVSMQTISTKIPLSMESSIFGAVGVAGADPVGAASGAATLDARLLGTTLEATIVGAGCGAGAAAAFARASAAAFSRASAAAFA